MKDKNKYPSVDLDDVVEKYADGHYVVPPDPNKKLDTSHVSAFIAEYKKNKQKHDRPVKVRQ